MIDEDKNRLSYWFPRIQEVIPAEHYPKTEIVPFVGGRELVRLLDGETPEGFDGFLADLRHAADRVGGYPTFLRHDLSSGKHDWRDTCLVPNADVMGRHVANSLNYWYSVNLFANGGEEIWAVREYVPVSPQVMTAFEGMPIGPERRYVVRDGVVTDHFPYWPLRAFELSNETLDERRFLEKMAHISLEPIGEVAELSLLACAAGKALGGDWTIDFMHTERAWLLIDCAQLADSWLPSEEDRAEWRRALNQ